MIFLKKKYTGQGSRCILLPLITRPGTNRAAETLLLKILGRLLHLSGHLLFEPIHFNQVNPIKTASKVRNSGQTHNPLFTGGTFVGFEKPQQGPILCGHNSYTE